MFACGFFFCFLFIWPFLHVFFFEYLMQVKSVFLDGLPPHWDEDKVREMFGKFGEIDSIQLARNMFTAKRKDFGFIGFTTRQSALDCIKVVNRDGVGEGSKKVTTFSLHRRRQDSQLFICCVAISYHLTKICLIICQNIQVCIKATLQRPRPAFKKSSWQGGSSMLGVRRGFVDKNSSGRVHHSDRYRRFSPERRPYRNSMDFEDRPVSLREHRGYYRRDSAAHGSFSFAYTKLFLSSFIPQYYHQYPIFCFSSKP